MLKENYGITSGVELKYLRIGHMTVKDLYKVMRSKSEHLRDDLPKKFSYFDCTACIDDDGKAVLSWAKPDLQNKMRWHEHFWLVVRYLRYRNPDVHSGYFLSEFLRELIYRLVCIGYDKTADAYKGEPKLDKKCQQYQIKVLLNS